MASGIFAVLDDIAALMDDVAVATKVATRKTAAILGDDLAVNAEKATGFVSSRELPVLWAITKGSLVNKAIIVPLALLLNAFLPVAVNGILIAGGAYLAYEGAEKIIHFLFHRRSSGNAEDAAIAEQKVLAPANDELTTRPDSDTPELGSAVLKAENSKIRSAVTTDFILSVEIVIISLGSVSGLSQNVQILTVSAVALIATVGVYGLVALIVRLDDIGLQLIQRSGGRGIMAKSGALLVASLPHIIRSLSVIGTIALLLVSGGIFVHSIPQLHDLLPTWPSIAREFTVGLFAGLLAVGIFGIFKNLIRIRIPRKPSP